MDGWMIYIYIIYVCVHRSLMDRTSLMWSAWPLNDAPSLTLFVHLWYGSPPHPPWLAETMGDTSTTLNTCQIINWALEGENTWEGMMCCRDKHFGFPINFVPLDSCTHRLSLRLCTQLWTVLSPTNAPYLIWKSSRYSHILSNQEKWWGY